MNAQLTEPVVYFPEWLSLNGVVPDRWHPHAKWVVGNVYERSLMLHLKQSDGSVPISAQHVKSVLGFNYLKVVGHLEDSGILVRGKSYRVPTAAKAGRCKLWKLADGIQESPFTGQPIADGPLAERVRQRRWKTQSNEHYLPVHRHLIDNLYRMEVAEVTCPHLQFINDRQWRHTIDGCGRLHTMLTNMPKVNRKQLRADGEPLWSVDIKNSQPLMAGLIGAGTSYSGEIQEWSRRMMLISGKEGEPYANAGMGIVTDSFLNDCLEGTVYEKLAEATGMGRSKAKVETLVYLFAPRKARYRDKMKAAFRKLYPSMLAVIESADGRKLACFMQTIESYMVIGRTCLALSESFPSMPIFTLHDSIVVRCGDIQKVRVALADQFWEVFGKEPRVAVEEYK